MLKDDCGSVCNLRQASPFIGVSIMFLRDCKVRLLFFIFAVAASAVFIPQVSSAQAPAAATAPAASPEIHAALEKTVYPKKVKVGDAVTARMTEPTKLKDGTELPKGTHILGKVTDIKLKADKEGPSKLGLLFDKAQLKDGKEIPLPMVLVSVAPRWEPGGVDSVAAANSGSSIGRTEQMSGAAANQPGSSGSTLNKGLGIRGPSGPTSPGAMVPGASYLPDITIASYSTGDPGTILRSSKTTVYVDAGSRLLLLVQ
jgi:hypothetical protein